jgi:Aldo/keto reductase family
MTGLRDRLVFGTARLAGGPYAARSRQMIEACIEAGIMRFDTAPGYGMGASEALLGEVSRGLKGIALHTKVGSHRPSASALRGWAKWLRNRAPNAAAHDRIDGEITRFSSVPPGMDFAAEAITRSLAQSRKRLHREQLDLVLLHEAEPQLIDTRSWAMLRAAAERGEIGRLGFAHSGPPQNSDPALTTQTAPLPQDFMRGIGGQHRIFHSVRRSLRAAMRQDPAVAAIAVQICLRYRLRLEIGAHEYLAGLLLLSHNWPEAGLIFATSRPENLTEFLGLLQRVEPAA